MKRPHEDSEDDFDTCSKITLAERAILNARRTVERIENDILRLVLVIQKTDKTVHGSTSDKLEAIDEQIKFLKQQTARVVEETELNAILHQVACSFVKVAGNTYHLYRRPSGQLYFSMLAPEEWISPYKHLGSYRLEVDQTWTRIENRFGEDADLSIIKRMLTFKTNLVLEQTPMEL